LVSEQQPEPAKKPEKKAKAREIKPAVVIDAETGKPEPTKGSDEPCALQSNAFWKSKPQTPHTNEAAAAQVASASNAATTVQPGTAAIQTEFEFAIQIEDHDDYEWFLRLTPIERGRVIAQARSAQ